MDIKALQAEIWTAFKNGEPITDVSYIKEFADLCRKYPYKESYKAPLNDLYKVMSTHLDSKDQSDEWWFECVKAVDAAIGKYENTDVYDFAIDYYRVVMNEIKRRSK